MTRIKPLQIIAALAGLIAIAGCDWNWGVDIVGRPAEELEPNPTVRWGGVVLAPEHRAMRNPRSDVEKVSEIAWPRVAQAPSPELGARIGAALDLRSVLGFSLDDHRREIERDESLDVDISYSVPFHRENLLDVSFLYVTQGGGAARINQRDVLLDLRTGRQLHARDLFVASRMPELARLVDERMQAEIAAARARGGWSDADFLDDAGRLKHFGPADLERFSLGDRGITFSFEFEPPPYQRLPGDYLLTSAELRPFLRPDGPLAAIVR
ncbi:MAG TPA: hypothetical protein VF092_00550 [Longimicrobium sp.]